MSKRRDRHQRGMRGPIAWPNSLTGVSVPLRETHTKMSFFASCIAGAVARITEHNPEILAGIDIGFEDVAQGLDSWTMRVPLGSAIPVRPAQR